MPKYVLSLDARKAKTKIIKKKKKEKKEKKRKKKNSSVCFALQNEIALF